MYTNVSDTFKEYIKKTTQQRDVYADFTYKNADGETVTERITSDDFVSNSFSLSASCFPSSLFGLGDVSSKDLSFSLINKNNKYNGCKFYGAKLVPYFGVKTPDGYEYCKVGTFYVDDCGKTYKKVINFMASDSILKAEKTFDGSGLSASPTAGEILSHCCNMCGITLSSEQEQFSALSLSVNVDTYGTETYRDVISNIASLCGGFSRINRDDELEIVQLKIDTSNSYEISPNFTRMNCEIDEPITIDSVSYVGSEKNYLVGDGKYTIQIENNAIFDGLNSEDLDTVLNNIYSLYNNFTYYPVQLEYLGDPILDPGDCIYLPNTEEGDVYTIVSNHNLNIETVSTIETDTCSELDKDFLQNNNVKKNTFPTSDIPDIEEEHENLALLTWFNRLTLPELGGNQVATSSGLTGYNNLECMSSRCIFANNSSSYYNQFLIPCETLEAGTYTVSFYCRRANTNTEEYIAEYLPGIAFINILSSAGSVKSRVVATPTETNSITINNKNWKWVSFTFTLGMRRDHPTIQLQMAQGSSYTKSSCEKYEVLLSRVMVEKGSVFTKYKKNKNEVFDFTGILTTTIGVHPVGQPEYLQISGGCCSIPICMLTNTCYVPGGSQIYISCNGSSTGIFTATRHWSSAQQSKFANDIKAAGSAVGIDFMTRNNLTSFLYYLDSDIKKRCLNYGTIDIDTSNNININCNSVILNGTTIGTIE